MKLIVQCGNLIIFLNPKSYVKLILDFLNLNFDFQIKSISHKFRVKKKHKFRHCVTVGRQDRVLSRRVHMNMIAIFEDYEFVHV